MLFTQQEFFEEFQEVRPFQGIYLRFCFKTCGHNFIFLLTVLAKVPYLKRIAADNNALDVKLFYLNLLARHRALLFPFSDTRIMRCHSQ